MKKNSVNLYNELKEIFIKYPLILNLLLITGVAFSLISFYMDFTNIKKNGSMDLRNRVVGARIYKHTNKNPYTFKWNDKTPEEYVDPFDFTKNFNANRLTVTPFAVWLHAIFCDLPYKTQQFLWYFFMLICLIATLFFTVFQSKGIRKKIILIAVLYIIFSSYFLRLHFDKGQIYIFYVFIYSMIYYIQKRKIKYHNFLSALLLAILIVLRPPALVILFMFFLMKKYKILIYSLILTVVFFTFPIFGHGIKIYKRYFSAMKQHSLLHIDKIKFSIKEYPNKSVIDGTKNLKSDKNYPLKDSSVQWLLKKYLGVILSSFELILLYFILVLPFFYVVFKYGNKINLDFFYLIIFEVFMLSDFFLPSARLSYNNVFWIFPLVIILKNINERNFGIIPFLFLFTAFVLNLLYYVNDVLLVVADYSFLVFLILSTISFLKGMKISR